MTWSDSDRAVIALLGSVEPGHRGIGRLVRERGAIETADMIAHGHAPTRAPESLQRRITTLNVDAVVERLEATQSTLLVPGHLDWPTPLNDLGDAAPIGLLTRGTLPLRLAATRSVAIVGARAMSDYGLRTASTFASDLADAGWSVVSGAAFGIDAAAHRGALAVGGSTIAVVASGIDVVYPAANESLFAHLLDEGVIVSECLPGRRPTRVGFLARNRVIAAMSSGVVVVEAALRSGALNTATWAGGLGRHVMAVPGPITSIVSAGCHRLIRDNAAVLVTSAADVLDVVGPIQAEVINDDLTQPLDSLDSSAAAVLEALPARRAASVDALVADTGLHPDAVLAALGRLLLVGAVRHGAEGWQRVRGLRGTPGRAPA